MKSDEANGKKETGDVMEGDVVKGDGIVIGDAVKGDAKPDKNVFWLRIVLFCILLFAMDAAIGILGSALKFELQYQFWELANVWTGVTHRFARCAIYLLFAWFIPRKPFLNLAVLVSVYLILDRAIGLFLIYILIPAIIPEDPSKITLGEFFMGLLRTVPYAAVNAVLAALILFLFKGRKNRQSVS